MAEDLSDRPLHQGSKVSAHLPFLNTVVTPSHAHPLFLQPARPLFLTGGEVPRS